MRRRKKKSVDVPLYKHNILWWLLVGWWWRLIMYLFWIFFNILFNVEIRFKKQI